MNTAINSCWKLALTLATLFVSNTVLGQGLTEMNPPPTPDPNGVTAIVGGRLIDGRGGQPVEDAIVVVTGNLITAAGPRDQISVPSNARIIDAAEMSIIPGLIDSHFHSKNDVKKAVEFELHHGITSFRDPGHPFKYYSITLQSKRIMPRIFLCGGHLDAAPAVWPDQAMVIAQEGDARRAVNAHVDRGASAIKVYFRLPIEHVQETCEAAAERDVLVTAHLELLDSMEAIDAGVRGIEHVTSFGLTLAKPDEAVRFVQLVRADSNARKDGRYRLWANIDLDSSPKLQPLLNRIVANGVFVSPTLAVFERQRGKKDATEYEAVAFENMMEFVGRCHDQGAKVVVGSHTYAPFAASGEAYLRELQLLVDCGISPLETITSATRHNAEFFGISDRLGTLEPGKVADLVVIAGDPSQRISDIQNVRRVMLNGSWVELGE